MSAWTIQALACYLLTLLTDTWYRVNKPWLVSRVCGVWLLLICVWLCVIMCVCVCMRVGTYVYAYVWLYVCTRLCLCIYLCLWARDSVYLCMCARVCVCVYIYLCVVGSVGMYACMCVWLYILRYAYNLGHTSMYACLYVCDHMCVNECVWQTRVWLCACLSKNEYMNDVHCTMYDVHSYSIFTYVCTVYLRTFVHCT